MPAVRPTLGVVAEQLYSYVAPAGYDEAAQGYPLAALCYATCASVEAVAALVRDDPATGEPGYSTLLDVDRAASESLDWLAQFVGVKIPSTVTMDAARRSWIHATGGFQRGTQAAMIGAIQPLLIGTQSVQILERTPDAYNFEVYTKTSETPSTTAVHAAIVAAKPAGLILYSYQAVSVNTWDLLHTNYATWNALYTRYATWNAMHTP